MVVFHDKECYHWANRLLKPGFWHVFAILRDDNYWIRLDARDGVPVVEVTASKDFDLADYLKRDGFTVVELDFQPTPLPRVMIGNCVGVVKAILGISNPLIFTPWQLFKHLRRVS